MKKHSDFSPSSFERRYLCPASYMMEKDLPPIKSKYADEGTLLHELITIDKSVPSHPVKWIGARLPAAFVVADCIKLVVASCAILSQGRDVLFIIISDFGDNVPNIDNSLEKLPLPETSKA